MTRDEAITRLHNIMGFDYHYLPADDAEAMDMAIEALQHPEIIKCQDCANAAETYMKKPWIYCDAIGDYYKSDEFYCAYARRREQ